MRLRAPCFLLAILTYVSLAAADESRSRLATLLGSDADPAFARATDPREFVFPDDHGPHPEFRNEWWYLTGNLDAEDGRRFGFELTIFRFALAPFITPSPSAWRTNQVYIAHLALTDAGGSEFYVAERYSRGAAGLAGARAEPFRVWIENWKIAAVPRSDRWQLSAGDEVFGLDLELTPLKAPVLNGLDGLSQKSAEPGNASYYYSVTRLATGGHVRLGEREFAVSGLSWLDREWSTSALGSDQSGWDWFALQLNDGSELMFYQLRQQNGTRDVSSAGTFIAADGSATYLANDEVDITVVDRWASPAGGSYPSRWQLRVPRLGLDLAVVPVLPDQELLTTVRYWEGAVDVSGSREETAVSGRGYVELTGYAEE